MSPADPSGLGAVLLVLGGGVAWLGPKLKAWAAASPKEQLDRAFREGEISLAEYEHRVELLLDEDTDRIRSLVEEVNNIGPKTSRDIALAFDSVDDLRGATRGELEAIHGVGESTAEAILQEVE